MTAIVRQVNELADLQGRSETILALAESNAVIRGNIGRKTAEIAAQLGRVGEVLKRAKVVADRVVGANDAQTAHLDKLETALKKAPTAGELDEQIDALSALANGLDGGPPSTPPSNLNPDAATFVPAVPQTTTGGYRYNRRRKTPTRKKTSSRRRRKHKTRRR